MKADKTITASFYNREPHKLSLEKQPKSIADLVQPWTTEEVASFLKIHPRTVTRMAVQGEIPAFRIGTHWRFRPIDVDSWMKQRVSSQAEHNPVRGN